MTPPPLVQLSAAWREALPELPPAMPIGAFFVTATGDALRIEPDGRCSRLVQAGRPHGGRAEDPS